ncbi:MAG: hypothetical protein JSS27_16375 [Planctomycetes bacterium]|nr:hypothetical protein [Planctomycetota bacterium]
MNANSNPTQNNNGRPTESDLYWTAFRYLTNELPANELTAFESRLADEQSAREALAATVTMVGALEASCAVKNREPVTITRPATRRAGSSWAQTARQRIGWAALGMAASLALMIGLQSLRPALTSLPTEIAARDRAAAAELALAWSQAAEEEKVVDADEQMVAALIDADHDLPAVNTLDSAHLPAWLVTAMQSHRPTVGTEN